MERLFSENQVRHEIDERYGIYIDVFEFSNFIRKTSVVSDKWCFGFLYEENQIEELAKDYLNMRKNKLL